MRCMLGNSTFYGEDFKIILLVFKALNGLGPTYLSDLLLSCEPYRTLRSSGHGVLTIPKVRTKTHGEAAFHYHGPCLWNSHPEDLRGLENVHICKSNLKTFLFRLAFSWILIFYWFLFCLNLALFYLSIHHSSFFKLFCFILFYFIHDLIMYLLIT